MEKCCVCDKRFKVKDASSVLRQKGVEKIKLIDSSIDAQVGDRVHIDCRRNLVRPPYAPVKSRRVKRPRPPDWFSAEIGVTIQERNRLHKLASAHNNSSNWDALPARLKQSSSYDTQCEACVLSQCNQE